MVKRESYIATSHQFSGQLQNQVVERDVRISQLHEFCGELQTQVVERDISISALHQQVRLLWTAAETIVCNHLALRSKSETGWMMMVVGHSHGQGPHGQ